MCELVLDKGNLTDFTSVSNVFIDEYMPKANGEFVKIYLHLLRLVNSGNEALSHQLSSEMIADHFNMLESDVFRALTYWADKKLLSLSFNESGALSGIKFQSAARTSSLVYSKDKGRKLKKNMEYTLSHASGESVSAPVPSSTGIVIPAKQKYSPKEIAAFFNDERVEQLTFLAQTYLGKTLSPSDINSILYMLEGLCFGTEFIEYIMETCISKGHKTLSYIEKQAVGYAKKGISTIEDAKNDEKLRKAIFKSIYKTFGLTPAAPVKQDIDFVTKWTDEYGFSDEIIIEACNRTMNNTHTGSFKYTDAILAKWYSRNVKSLKDVEKLDKEHSEQLDKPSKARQTKTKRSKTFDQRSYDYNELEKQLLANRDKKLKSKN